MCWLQEKTLLKTILKLAPFAGATLFLVVVFGFGISGMKSMPGNAVLLVNHETGEYISPPCFTPDKHTEPLVPVRSEDIHGKKYHPEPECREASGFIGESQSLWSTWLFPKPSRWNDDGTWRY